jgi:hypothetical protein
VVLPHSCNRLPQGVQGATHVSSNFRITSAHKRNGSAHLSAHLEVDLPQPRLDVSSAVHENRNASATVRSRERSVDTRIARDAKWST